MNLNTKFLVCIFVLIMLAFNLKAQHNYDSQSIIYSKGQKVGIGIADPSFKLQVAGDVYANGGWFRVAGSKGIYFQTHGGGFYMNESNWIRTYGDKSFYHNTGFMRTDGVFQVGPNGDRFLVKQDGRVGINTTDPSFALEVAGEVYASEGWFRAGGKRGLYFQTYGGGLYMTDNTWIRTYGNKSFYHNTGVMRTDGTFQVGPNGNRFLVDGSGAVGINTTFIPADYKMAVNGKIITTEVRVKPYNAWPDYVFAPNYELTPLKELAAYIKTEKHLPGVPSAQEITETGGFELGQMTQTLLEKVEELTLYMIDLEEKNRMLEEESNALKQRMEMLEK